MVFVETLISNRVGVAALNNPPLNISTKELKDELREMLVQFEKNPSVSVVLMTGKGAKAFSVGSDIKEFNNVIKDNTVKERAEHENALNNYIEYFPKPTIAAINGFALGGGLELALACDMRFCSRNCKLGVPEIKLGLFPGGGGSERLPRLLGYTKALEMMLTGEVIDAEEALRIGLVNRIIDGDVFEHALKIAEQIAAFSPDAILRIKKITKRNMELPFGQANHLAIEDSVKAFHSKHGQEGINAFLEKRSPNFND